MNLPELKREFGRCSTSAFWARRRGHGKGVASWVRPRRSASRSSWNVETLMPGGGYVFATVHNIQEPCAPGEHRGHGRGAPGIRRLPLVSGGWRRLRLRLRPCHRWPLARRSSRQMKASRKCWTGPNPSNSLGAQGIDVERPAEVVERGRQLLLDPLQELVPFPRLAMILDPLRAPPRRSTS